MTSVEKHAPGDRKSMRIIGITAGIITLAAVCAADDWWNTDWGYRQRLYINPSAYTEDLDRFPLSIWLPGTASICEHSQPGGKDLRAVDAQGESLATEIVRWSADGIELHLLAAHIAANQPGQYIDLYYGNPQAPEQPPGKVWENGYRAVLHLAGNLDNAANGAAGGNAEGMVHLRENAEFPGDEPGFIRLSPEICQGLGENITISIRFRAEENPGEQTLAAGQRAADGKDWFNFGLKLPDTMHTNATSGGQQAPELNVQSITPGQWHGAVVRYDARQHTRTINVDGVQMKSDAGLPGPLRVDEIRIGRGLLHFDPWQFHGLIDEVRIADAGRSDAWLQAETGCLGPQNSFYIAGPPQKQGDPPPPPGPVMLLSPADQTIVRKRAGAVLAWTPSAGAAEYKVLLFDSPDAAVSTRTLDAGPFTHLGLAELGPDKRVAYWSVLALSNTGVATSAERRKIEFYDWSGGTAQIPENRVSPVLQPARGAVFHLEGYLAARIDRVIRRYLLETPESSPAILQVFKDRDKRPVRDPLVPWAGEFAGKYLTAAELTWRLTNNQDLRQTIDDFAHSLVACQAEDGYLGPFPGESRLTGSNWDIWGHYHCLLGLMLFYEDTECSLAYEACKKAADLLFETFGPGGPALTNDGSGGEMNMAVCHGLILLYRKTGIERYLDLAKYIVHEAWNSEGAGHYLECALAGKPLIEFPRHRWESIHDWQALAELYWLTGDDQYRRAFEHIWREGLRGDRHNTGGVTSGEGFQGTPYHTGAIETCCTVAWIAFSIDMLRMTGDSRVADEIEWSTFNSALGAIPFSGRACAYNVPMDGTRTFGVELPWQAPKAGPDLNCCAVNANRPLGMISQWAIMEDAEGLALNFYGPGEFSAALPGENRVTLRQNTAYPVENTVRIEVTLETPAEFALKLRIPGWSAKTEVRVNGEPRECVPGAYCAIKRPWQTGDVVELTFDFGIRAWSGEGDFAGKMCLFRGPLLLAYDARFNDINPDELPQLDAQTLSIDLLRWEGALPPWCAGMLTDAQGNGYRVCDFSSAGQTGNHYRSWLPAQEPRPPVFGETVWK